MDEKEINKELRRKLRRDSTPPERMIWALIKSKQIGYKFRRQESIGPFIVDFLCKELDLVVEIDGSHHSIPEAYERDVEREEYIRKQGYTVVRYSAQEVLNNLHGFIEDIKLRCDAFQGK